MAVPITRHQAHFSIQLTVAKAMSCDASDGPSRCFPVRGVPSGWRDVWDEPNDHAGLRARAETVERRYLAQARVIGRRWQQEVAAERRQTARER
jgi:hypothetical protein